MNTRSAPLEGRPRLHPRRVPSRPAPRPRADRARDAGGGWPYVRRGLPTPSAGWWARTSRGQGAGKPRHTRPVRRQLWRRGSSARGMQGEGSHCVSTHSRYPLICTTYMWSHPVDRVDLGDGTCLHCDETRHLGGNLAHALLGSRLILTPAGRLCAMIPAPRWSCQRRSGAARATRAAAHAS